MDWVAGLSRWFHYLAGVMWIGLLYYFNFVQGQALAQANKNNEGAGITKYVAPLALQYFRWAALATWVMGVILLSTLPGNTCCSSQGFGAFMLEPGYVGIGMGAWLGTIMLLNVWVLIYPNQMKVLGKVPATDEEKARARRTAFLVSRINTMLSLPMLFFMAFGFSHRGIVGL
jgi:uncharacterized membrane protein